MSEFDNPHRGAFVCPHVFHAERPILLVVHEGGDWQFLCGGTDHSDGRLVGIGHLIERDATLREVEDLAEGEQAERERVGAPWLRGPVE
ncbi:hypothetical protein IP92_02438 [Pseudoduganella flava]|uniref:Uncharacterized protein n=1 Tax=Pseudoduganella flava TaxID=871742 RepID=A0A562PSJ0_9BURK|nr:hypothetical protein [Pseudoduganella flava]QGZ39314.1 hypothetical protein GO485_09825 [Pseudoduganella flava]TWI47379.1 hypothetical protein IP92_02438 [Pseudoduganella flava]